MNGLDFDKLSAVGRRHLQTLAVEEQRRRDAAAMTPAKPSNYAAMSPILEKRGQRSGAARPRKRYARAVAQPPEGVRSKPGGRLRRGSARCGRTSGRRSTTFCGGRYPVDEFPREWGESGGGWWSSSAPSTDPPPQSPKEKPARAAETTHSNVVQLSPRPHEWRAGALRVRRRRRPSRADPAIRLRAGAPFMLGPDDADGPKAAANAPPPNPASAVRAAIDDSHCLQKGRPIGLGRTCSTSCCARLARHAIARPAA